MRQGEGKITKIRLSATMCVCGVLTAFSLSLLFLSTRSFIVDFKDMGLSMFSGVRGGVYELSSLVSRTVLAVRELADLREAHDELLKRMARYEELERSNAEITMENTRLREQLDFAQTIRYRHIPAEIIGRDPDNLFSVLVINKGRYSGVAKDMAVIAWQNGTQALVGKVVQAGLLESLVKPLYDVSVASRFVVSRYEGIVEGQGSPDTALLMRFIPKRAREEINVGDLISSSGMGGVYPPGINIGRVSKVTYRDYDISMEAELEPVIDFSRLEYVFVIEAEALTEPVPAAGARNAEAAP